ncbi:MAG: type II toxin-antitoxin system HicB family antitoxin [Synergistaceae bacterium]|nr:type II toxin-antitoxin system HicB family antitoxin [Synergistaceae bacterium]
MNLEYTICYTKTESGYMGQLLEWPEIISEGSTIDECRSMVEDAAREMIAVYREDGLPIPQGHSLFESITITETENVSQPA